VFEVALGACCQRFAWGMSNGIEIQQVRRSIQWFDGSILSCKVLLHGKRMERCGVQCTILHRQSAVGLFASKPWQHSGMSNWLLVRMAHRPALALPHPTPPRALFSPHLFLDRCPYEFSTFALIVFWRRVRSAGALCGSQCSMGIAPG